MAQPDSPCEKCGEMNPTQAALRQGALALILTLVVSPSRSQPQEPVSPGELPPYKAQQGVSGTIRNFGFGLAGVLASWEEGFRQIHPDIHFEDHLPTSD